MHARRHHHPDPAAAAASFASYNTDRFYVAGQSLTLERSHRAATVARRRGKCPSSLASFSGGLRLKNPHSSRSRLYLSKHGRFSRGIENACEGYRPFRGGSGEDGDAEGREARGGGPGAATQCSAIIRQICIISPLQPLSLSLSPQSMNLPGETSAPSPPSFLPSFLDAAAHPKNTYLPRPPSILSSPPPPPPPPPPPTLD